MARQHGVLHLDKYKFDFYSELSSAILRFNFTPDIVRDFDIVNRDVFVNQIKLFIQQNALMPVSFVVVLSDDVLFGKEIKLTDKAKKDNEVEAFLDTVPFDSVGSTIVDLPNSLQVLATNKDVYDSIKAGFEANGLSMDMVVPAFLIKDVNLANGLTPESAQAIIGKLATLRQYNFIAISKEPRVAIDQGTPPEVSVKKNKRLFLLLGVFGLLIAVLVLVVLFVH